jgi:hypothetical protein
MMKKYLLLFIAISLVLLVSGQEKTNLSDLLWNQVGLCSSIDSPSKEGNQGEFTVIDDSENGFLKIDGGFPPGGCECSQEVGAFTNNDGTYTTVDQEFWNCQWIDMVKSNRDLKEVFPEDFGIGTFIPNAKLPFENRAMFYVRAEVPRVGTDLKVTIQTIPFGLNIEGENGFCFGYRQNEDYSNCKYVSSIRTLGYRSYSSEVIKNIINGNYDGIPDDCVKIIENSIGDEMPFLLDSFDEFGNYLKFVQIAYKYYQKLKYDYVILAWDVKKSRFYIKEKHKIEEKYNFKEFVSNSCYWSPI